MIEVSVNSSDRSLIVSILLALTASSTYSIEATDFPDFHSPVKIAGCKRVQAAQDLLFRFKHDWYGTQIQAESLLWGEILNLELAKFIFIICSTINIIRC